MINLDKGLQNKNFELRLDSYGYKCCEKGYQIDGRESYILDDNYIVSKETLMKTSIVDELRYGKFQPTEDNINLSRLNWQIDGNTILHYYALDYEKLVLITDYLEEEDPSFLMAILMKNKRGKSPLDITLDNESPKNTEILLKKLAVFKDLSLSKVFYQRFPELLGMDLTAFHDYLES